ncbi:serine/threonine-protein kinase [Nonomuraea sp. NBC_01738]|uniref:serine/threonine-protein kinase n=1 Tax=Nonomuraea sp. NBC_01738 TaxID=2976003 RepID=UPI002E0F9D90|nr:serine/threonine-protein kinase [Nonomuraea sp. NBC_01738]
MPQISPLVAGDPDQLGSFRLSGRIGEGGQGIVYLGVDDQGERAAIKLLHVKFSGDTIARSRFARELKAAERVASFCTARVMEADLEGNTPYIASEYIDGRALRDIVDTDGPLRGTALDRLAIGTATALTAIHHASIVHRDFKPDNVLIAADGPRVVDFGIARIIDSTGTITSRAIGTPAYMAPEQIAGEDVGPYTDVFAWGATIAFAATGVTAFEGKSIAVVLNRILNHEVDVSAMPEPLRGVVRSALSKDPQARPTADQLLLRLLGQPDSSGASTAVMSRGAEVAGDDTTPFTRVRTTLSDHARTDLGRTDQGRTDQSRVEPAAGVPVTGQVGFPAQGKPSDTGIFGLAGLTGPTGMDDQTTGAAAGATTGTHTGLATGGGSAGGPPGGSLGGPAGGGFDPSYGGAPETLREGPVEGGRRSRAGRWVAVVVVILALAVTAAVALLNGWPPGFGATQEPTPTPGRKGTQPGPFTPLADKVAQTGKIIIGVKGDLPGIGLVKGDTFEGFDVDMGKRIAAALGAKNISFVRVHRDDRATVLATGAVDMVVASYSIDKSEVRFAGPYYIAHHDVLVRGGGEVAKLSDLKGKKLCAPDSPSVGAVQDKVSMETVPAANYAVCMDLLRNGGVDAVPGEDLLLAGFANRENLRFKVLGARLSDQRYAVGLKQGDGKTCKAVEGIIADLYRKGAVADLLTRHFGKVEFTPERKQPAMEPCG